MEALKEKVAAGQIDTVITAIPDMQGRLMGKRFQAEFFLDSAWEENPLLQLPARDRSRNVYRGWLRFHQLVGRLR